MSPNAARHQALLKVQTKLACLALVVVGTIGILAYESQNGNQQIAVEKAQSAAKQAHFYRVIAGEDKADLPTVDNALAVQLQDRLGPLDSQADSLPERILAYRGTTNQDAGIIDALGGLDPFVESHGTCQECGPLTENFKRTLLSIKQGKVEKIIQSQTPPAFNHGYTLTPFGLSGLETGLLIWLLGGPLVLLAAHRLAKAGRNEYRLRHFGDLDWRWNGEGDGSKFATQLMAPSFFLPYRAYRLLNRRRFEHKVRERFGLQMDEIDEIDHFLGKVSLRHGDDPNVQTLQKERDEFVAELESHARAGESALDCQTRMKRQQLIAARGLLQDVLTAQAEIETNHQRQLGNSQLS